MANCFGIHIARQKGEDGRTPPPKKIMVMAHNQNFFSGGGVLPSSPFTFLLPCFPYRFSIPRLELAPQIQLRAVSSPSRRERRHLQQQNTFSGLFLHKMRLRSSFFVYLVLAVENFIIFLLNKI